MESQKRSKLQDGSGGGARAVRHETHDDEQQVRFVVVAVAAGGKVRSGVAILASTVIKMWSVETFDFPSPYPTYPPSSPSWHTGTATLFGRLGSREKTVLTTMPCRDLICSHTVSSAMPSM